jgi:hypothetical protein
MLNTNKKENTTHLKRDKRENPTHLKWANRTPPRSTVTKQWQ